MPGSRRDRVAHLVQAKLAELLLREARDPRLRGVTVTDVKMTADLRIARVFYRLIPPDADRAAAEQALTRATPFLRGAVGRTLGMRATPELRFEFDVLPETAERVESLLAGVTPDEGGDGPDGEGDA